MLAVVAADAARPELSQVVAGGAAVRQRRAVAVARLLASADYQVDRC